MPKDDAGKSSKGFAFVEYSKPEARNPRIKLHVDRCQLLLAVV
jgi:hypothetical protein